MTIPQYLIDILLAEAPGIEAQRLNDAITAAGSPHLRPRDRRELLGSLQRTMKRGLVRLPAAPKDPSQRDPEEAARWFAERGARVTRASAEPAAPADAA